MASYVGVSDLNADLSGFRPDQTLTSSTEPTLVQAGVVRDRIEAEANAAMKRAGYTVPVSSSDSPYAWGTIYLALISGVSAYVYRARGYTPVTGDMSNDVVALEAKHQEFLEAVANVPGYLVDATTITGGPEVPVAPPMRSIFTDDTDIVDDAKDGRAFQRSDRF